MGNNKEKAMIYPFDSEFAPIIRHRNLLKDYEITKLVSVNGWALVSEDSSVADGSKTTEIEVTADFSKALSSCDTVIISDSYMKADFKKIIYPKIVEAIQNNKNIVCTVKLEEKMLNDIKVMCESRKVNFSYCVCEKKYNILNMEAVQLEKIQTPIIFVLGTGDRSGKFEIQLCLRENLMQMGYKVSQVGSRNYCELMDFHSFPQFMYSTEITEEEKVIYFNNFIKNIELNDNSDVIIIGIPGGIMPFNDKYTNGFGILAYEISQAVKADAAVFTTLYEDYNKEYFESIDNTIKYKFGFEIDCYNLSNIQFDWMKFENLNERFYITLDYNFISKKKDKLNSYKLNKPIYNILEEKGNIDMAQYLINRLSEDENYNIV
ncbi:hypothetical protein NPD7_697 [Clostridium sporogenes]|uniref:TIGR04066 family peptide maturation system protein n=1 Tax=Clostridium TaxID=1485 RepID=UPI00090A9E43|nr:MULTISPECIES: TIGR04066 family peptide maturation system protein [Clostridium]APF27497.1 hypothetical protein NPD7_697 [Clostridium sporogenes]MDI6918511.1 TIGR04066 family peptide maturation system protein [Clostridium botulinum]WMU96456.1 TIGR04066 family peptide maturation system protein [Clostridium botulinum]